jgi:hypothetical protein
VRGEVESRRSKRIRVFMSLTHSLTRSLAHLSTVIAEVCGVQHTSIEVSEKE